MTICLIVSVIYMEKAIANAGIGVANRKLVILHIINFSVWLITYTAERVCYFQCLIVGNQYKRAKERGDESLYDDYDSLE